MRDNTQLLVKAAQLYYEEDVTQNELAEILNVSRPTVSRLLKKAKDEGIVEIKVHDPIVKDHEMSSRLRKLLGLKDVVVISGKYDYEKALERCTEAAIQFFDAIMHDDCKIGITWGSVPQYFCDLIGDRDYDNVTVIQMVGCLGTNIPDVDGSRLAITLAQKFNGDYFNIHSPIYVHKKEVRDYLSDEPAIRETLNMAMNTDIILTGIGSFDSASTICKAGYWNESDLMHFRRLGAVGHMLGRPYDEYGKPVEREGLYIIGAPLDALHKAKWSIGISASEMKAEATLGAAQGGFINVLIADHYLATKLIDMLEDK